jgi:iron complex outermembrane recepter protein
MRLSIAAAVTSLIMGVALADHATAAIRKSTNIPPQGLGTALQALAQERDLQVVYLSDAVDKLKTAGAVGEFTADEALRKLLSGTGLSYRYLDEKTVTVMPIASAVPAPSGSETAKHPGRIRDGFAADVWDRFRVAQLSRPATAGAGSADTGPANNLGEWDSLREVVVTAQKRTERAQDVPVPVAVINAQALADNSQVLLRDYYATVPGLDVVPNFFGVTNVSIRGISAGAFGTPTVSIAVDDVPFGGSTAGIGNFMPEIDPGDLDRIEVLRGPQGTLYGANSMGGLIKYVTKDPSTDGFSGRIETGTSSVKNGAEPGFDVRAAANIPLSDTFAIRVSGFRRQDPGYIDNVLPGQQGVNEAQADGARLSAMWRPTGDLSLKISALYQHMSANGVSEVDTFPGLQDLQQERLPNTGGFDRTIRAFSANFDYKIGGVELASVTGYNTVTFRQSLDETPTFGLDLTPYGSSAVLSDVGVQGARGDIFSHGNKFSQELRLTMPLGERFSWLLGGFYTRENAYEIDSWPGEDPASGRLQGNLLYLDSPKRYTEYAAFSDLTYQITDRIDVQVGGRESFIKSATYPYYLSGELYGPTPVLSPEADSSSKAFTYLVTPRYKLSSDLTAYARFASGYRLGGGNTAAAILSGAPATFAPDKTENYELGVKGDFLNHVLSVDASLFYIPWKGLQTQLTTPDGQQSFTANAGEAKSEGVELSLTARPLQGLTITAWGDYDDAVLTKAFPAGSPASAPAGARLPNSAKWSGNASVEQAFPLWSGATGFIGAAASYVGDRENIFVAANQPRFSLPSYTKVDLRAGVKVDSWTANFFVNNVGDSRGLLENHVANNLYPFAVIPITPRTVGLSVARIF